MPVCCVPWFPGCTLQTGHKTTWLVYAGQLLEISFVLISIGYLLWPIRKPPPLIHRLFKFGTGSLIEFLVHIVLHSLSNNLGLPAKQLNYSFPFYLIYL